jgi:hypothetical protein
VEVVCGGGFSVLKTGHGCFRQAGQRKNMLNSSVERAKGEIPSSG